MNEDGTVVPQIAMEEKFNFTKMSERYFLNFMKLVSRLQLLLGSWCFRTDDPPASRELLGVLGVDKLFDYMEIFPSQKYAHFKNIKKSSGLDYSDMLFFDDEYRNIRDISKLGVTCFYINDDQGISLERLRKGLKQFNDSS